MKIKNDLHIDTNKSFQNLKKVKFLKSDRKHYGLKRSCRTFIHSLNGEFNYSTFFNLKRVNYIKGVNSFTIFKNFMFKKCEIWMDA